MMYFPSSGRQFISGQRDGQAEGRFTSGNVISDSPLPFWKCGLSVKIFQFVVYLISLSQTETRTDSTWRGRRGAGRRVVVVGGCPRCIPGQSLAVWPSDRVHQTAATVLSLIKSARSFDGTGINFETVGFVLRWNNTDRKRSFDGRSCFFCTRF